MWILLIFLTTMIIFCLFNHAREKKIQHWRNAWNLNQHECAYQELFSSINAYKISQHARIEHDAIDYIYGEIDFVSFIALLSLVNPDEHTIFYDLGSGVGTAVIACAMVFKVQESNGIELLTALHETALLQQQKLKRHDDYQANADRIHFINSDFLEVDFKPATLIFINATALFGSIWNALSLKIEQDTCCSIVITTSKPLTSTAFIVIQKTYVQMSWGTVSAYIQRRR